MGNWTSSVGEPVIIASEISNFRSTSDDCSLNQLSEENQQKLNEFKFEMERKHEKRREILAAKKKEFEDLREEVKRLQKENENLRSVENKEKSVPQLHEKNQQLREQLKLTQSNNNLMEDFDKLLHENTTLKGELKDKTEQLDKIDSLLDKNRELKINIAEMQEELQNLNSVVVEFEKEREEYKTHVVALKDVISVSKKMLLIRESQLKELREKVESIEQSLSGKEINILSQDLRKEYERQLQSIRNLRTLYEERQRSDHREKEELKKLLEETKKELETEQNKNKELDDRINELEELNSQKYDQIKSLESNLGLSKAESRQYQAELTVINQLFSEVLLGFNNSQEIDLDKLTKHLEDHHGLLQNIVVNEISPESSSALPKVLLDLVNKVHSEEQEKNKYQENQTSPGKLKTFVEESDSQASTEQINSVEEIVQLLPKVWRVLIELLSHQKVPTNILTSEVSDVEDPCYKTVQTPKGPSVVLSVSQTFIRLKDLIMEKKALEKETGHLKQLNTHLETRLQDQEKRLVMVSTELNKTWHVVGQLQKQHQLLHTQEKILRYELAQKRKLLTTLKEELEYSREKWQEAREKNSKTEKQWRQLRVEFASRRNTLINEDVNNSQESGYSDERCSSSDDEPGYETDVSECAPKQNDEVEEVLDDEPDSQSEKKTHQEQVGIKDTCFNLVSEKNNEESAKETNQEQVGIRDTCFNLVSSVIDEAVASIKQNVHDSSNSQSKTESNSKNNCSDAGSSRISPGPSTSKDSTTVEELLVAKEERLKRLEGQCQRLVEQVNNTTCKSVLISNKLDDLHGAYGENSSSSSSDKSLDPESNSGLNSNTDSQ